MIFNWVPFFHANETSWQSNKLNITISIKDTDTLRGKKKKKVIQARSQRMQV